MIFLFVCKKMGKKLITLYRVFLNYNFIRNQFIVNNLYMFLLTQYLFLGVKLLFKSFFVFGKIKKLKIKKYMTKALEYFLCNDHR